MRFAVRGFQYCFSILLGFLFLILIPTTAFAQTTQPQTNPATYALPNTDPGVPQNQHTLAQTTLINILGAIACQLTGIDPIDPLHGCLGINPDTGRLGYASSAPSAPQIGGLLGVAVDGIGAMYTPTFGSGEYMQYLSSNFGIVKHAYAAGSGFDALKPVLELWKATRNIAYFLLIIAFIFIGVGIMLRIRIDPRTVMTIQNQIPRVIIAIILITFSYAIAGLMIDLMWAGTYVGINAITAQNNPSMPGCGSGSLNSYATSQIVQDPISFVNKVFIENCGVTKSGLFDFSKNIAGNIVGLEKGLIMTFLLGPDAVNAKCDVGKAAGKFAITAVSPIFSAFSGSKDDTTNLGQCAFNGFVGTFMTWLTSIVWFLIVFVVIMITLFRVWFELLKAYALVLIYTILAPIFIVINLLPKRPLGFERWIRVYFANVAVFPSVVFMFLLAREFIEIFKHPTAETGQFVPPLVGNPGVGNFGAILAFGILLMTPQLLSLLREKLGVPPVKQASAALGAVAAGGAVVGAPVRQGWKRLNKRDQYGNPIGPISYARDTASKGALTGLAKFKVPFAQGALDRQKYMREGAGFGSLRGYREMKEREKTARKQWMQRFGTDRDFKPWFDSAENARNRGQQLPPMPGQPTAQGNVPPPAQPPPPTTPPPATPRPQGPTGGGPTPAPAGNAAPTESTIRAGHVILHADHIELPGGGRVERGGQLEQNVTGRKFTVTNITNEGAAVTYPPTNESYKLTAEQIGQFWKVPGREGSKVTQEPTPLTPKTPEEPREA